jgi:hypothetical protein
MKEIQVVLANQDPVFFRACSNDMISKLAWHDSRYCTSSIDYYRQRAEDLGHYIIDKSFIIVWKKKSIFQLVGFLQQTSDHSIFTLGELPAILLEAPTISIAQKKCISNYLDQLINENPALYRFTDNMYHGKIQYASEHILRNHGFHGSYTYNRITDLGASEEAIKRSIRRSYDSQISWGLRELDIKIYDSSEITIDIINEFMMLHAEAAGYQTRSYETWLKQYQSILQGEAFVITGRIDDQLVTAGYFIMANRHCYYGVSASKRSMFSKPLFHAIMWRAIVHARNNGCLVFDSGTDYPTICSIPFSVSKKELDIAKFKSGFGGHLKPSLTLCSHEC